jgi:Putative peptidoglycan binding domain
VLALQSNLNLCYAANLTNDGIFGSRTKAALQAAQRSDRADDDGVYGPVTRRAITWFRDDGAGCVSSARACFVALSVDSSDQSMRTRVSWCAGIG